MHISYLVLYVNNIEASRAFYETIGCQCIREQHGQSPVHYAMAFGDCIVELYPKGTRPVSSVRLGFCVEKSLLQIKGELEASLKSFGEHKLVVIDPDGNTVELKALWYTQAMSYHWL